MGRRHDDERTRENRTRNYPGGYDRQGGNEHREHRGGTRYGPYFDRDGSRYFEDDYGNRHYEEDNEARYYRERDREREYYHREREQKQETRRTGMMVIGGICIALIALVGVMAVTGGEDSSQSAQQAPQEQAPQQAPQQPAQPEAPQQQPQETPAAPPAPQQDGASSEEVEGMRADIERQLAEIRQSINGLRLEIMSWFASDQAEENSQ